MIFGSALKDFGVAELLACLTRWAPDALPRKTTTRAVDPAESEVSGFVFKVQANMLGSGRPPSITIVPALRSTRLKL